MKQVFYPYTMWEDFKNGMYDEVKEGRSERIQFAIECLSNPAICYEQMKRVTSEWKIATEQNLTNPTTNHQAWLGQSACNIYKGVKEDETREAWGMLTREQRIEANKIADKVDREWVEEYSKTKPDYQLSLFDVI